MMLSKLALILAFLVGLWLSFSLTFLTPTYQDSFNQYWGSPKPSVDIMAGATRKRRKD